MSDTFASLVFDLERLGFFAQTPAGLLADVKNDAIYHTSLLDERSGRVFAMEPEAVARGGAGEFLKRVGPFLLRQGVASVALREHFAEDGYSINWGGVRYDLEKPEDDHPRWALATARLCAAIDERLESAGSPQRIYAVHFGGSPCMAIFLTEAMCRRIAQAPEMAALEEPMNSRRMQEEAEYIALPGWGERMAHRRWRVLP